MANVGGDTVSREQDSESGSTGTDSGSTEEEERLRRLFHACDRDGDGFIDRQDLDYMCEQLGLEECCAEDIMTQLGVDCNGLICFEEFALCRQRLMADIEQEKLTHEPPMDSGFVPQSSGEVVSLYGLLEEHNPRMLQEVIKLAASTQATMGQNFMDTLNSLHLVALSGVRRDLVELGSRWKHMVASKAAGDKLIARLQAEKAGGRGGAREDDGGTAAAVERVTVAYEQRVVELHSVIAELQRKLERHQIPVIQEEEGEYDDEHASNRSNGELSVNENNANDSHAPSIAEIGEELNAELSKVVQQLETAIRENQESRMLSPVPPAPRPTTAAPQLTAPTPAAAPMPRQGAESSPSPGKLNEVMSESPMPASSIEQEMAVLREESELIHGQLGKQETELHKLRAQLASMREERDRLKRKVRELQGYIQSMEATTPPQVSSPTKPPLLSQRSAGGNEHNGVKVAELKKLKTGETERPITGAEITSVGLPNAKVAEHLSQSLQDSSSVQETLSSLQGEIPQGRVHEFEIELERLQSKVEHVRAQNDVLCVTLEESKALCSRLSVLLGRHESRATALTLAAAAGDGALEAGDALLALARAQLATLLAHCRAAGIASIADSVEVGGMGGGGGEDVSALLQRVQQTRRSVEQQARQVLAKLSSHHPHLHITTTTATTTVNSTAAASGVQPWEDLSSHTTASTASASSSASTGEGEAGGRGEVEQRLREHMEALRGERRAVLLTAGVELEAGAVLLEPVLPQALLDELPDTAATAHRLDLENAVLMQELAAIKEEKAELKASNYLLLNEKAALELKLSGKESQEKAYLVTIEHLKSEVTDQMQEDSNGKKPVWPASTVTPAITLEELRGVEAPAGDLAEAARRERKLKAQVAELVATLEKLSRNSEHRHQQSAEFVNDLKRANSALVAAYEKNKKKYMAKIRKLEEETAAMQKQLTLQHQQLHLSQSSLSSPSGSQHAPPVMTRSFSSPTHTTSLGQRAPPGDPRADPRGDPPPTPGARHRDLHSQRDSPNAQPIYREPNVPPSHHHHHHHHHQRDSNVQHQRDPHSPSHYRDPNALAYNQRDPNGQMHQRKPNSPSHPREPNAQIHQREPNGAVKQQREQNSAGSKPPSYLPLQPPRPSRPSPLYIPSPPHGKPPTPGSETSI